jgi:putative PIN family toxin of toxin-antitoxin system
VIIARTSSEYKTPTIPALHQVRTRFNIARNMRIVADTNVVVAALRSPEGASAAVMRLLPRGGIVLLATVPLFLEYEEVLLRPEQLKASGLSPRDVGIVLDVLAKHIEPVEPFYLWRPLLKDADDDMVLECAANGRADALVTWNTRDFTPVAVRFGIAVLTPVELLRRFSQ